MYLLPQNMSTLILIDPKFFDIFYQIFFSVFDGNKFFCGCRYRVGYRVVMRFS